MEDPIYRPKQAMSYLGVQRTALYQWVRNGLLAAPIKLGPRARGWRKSTLDKFIESRQAATEQAGR
jgi:prophage regulatory protein